ncbi:MAG: hypothetical protein IPK85_18600 [Gemmatimonadetes bacterium]|nr:hypothetical protein [Gemmatimonadota bacterium]
MRGKYLSVLLVLWACAEAPVALPPTIRATAPVQVHVPANCNFWLAPVDGDWDDPTNWSLGVVPYYNSWACITTPGSYTVTVDSWGVADLYLGDGTSDIRLEVVANALPTRGLDVDRLFVYANARLVQTSGAPIEGEELHLYGAYDARGDNIWGDLEVYAGGILNVREPSRITSSDVVRFNGYTFLSTAADLSLSGGGYVYITGSISGDARMFVDDAAEVLLANAHFGTLLSAPTDPILRVRGSDVDVFFNATGAVEVDPAGETVELIGEMDSAMRVLVRKSQWGTSTLRLGDGNRPLANEGTLELQDGTGTSLSVVGSVVSTGTITLGPGRLAIAADSLRNEGTITVADSTTLSSGFLRNLGTVQVLGSPADLVVSSAASFYAEPTGATTGTIVLANAGRLRGRGSMERVVSLGGVVSPGTTTTHGTLTVSDLSLDAASRVVIDVGGTANGTYDAVHTTSRLTMAGTVDLQEIAPFTGGVCGQSFEPLTRAPGSSRSGAFAQWTGLTPGTHRAWRTATLQNSIAVYGYDPTRRVSLSAGAVGAVEGGASGMASVCIGSNTPTATVTVTPGSRLGQTTPSPIPLSFTTTNWFAPQALTVTAIDDLIGEAPRADSIRFRLTSADPAYHNLVPLNELAVIVADNDPAADLAVSLLSAPDSVNANQVFEARYRVINNGPGVSNGSTFTITAMDGMTFQSSTPQVTCRAGVGILTCTVAALAAGAQVDFTLVMRAGVAGSYINTVRIVGVDWDVVAGNDSFLWNLTVN